MNILVSCMGYDGGKSGISAYMKNAVSQLLKTGANITLLVDAGSEKDFGDDVKTISAPAFFSKSAPSFVWHIFATPFIARSKKYDSFLILAANRRFAPFVKIPTVGVVHDLSQYRVEGKYDSIRMFYLKKIQPMLGRRFSTIAAISKSTLEDVVKFWKYPREKLFLNYNGLNPISAQPDASILKKLSLEKGNYIYYVSRIEHPGKNHTGLISAFEAIPQDIRKTCKLVFTGAKWPNSEAVFERAKKSPLASDIVFSGFVSDAELAALYYNASVFAFPSFSEGFGLPLIEAMNAGIPCACSSTSSLGEIGKGAAELFNPDDTKDISRVLSLIISDKTVAEELSQKGKMRAKDFDWHLHSQKLFDACLRTAEANSKLEIFDIEIDNGRSADIVDEISGRVLSGKRTCVAFANAHYLNAAYEDKSQSDILKKFDMILPDGSGIALACLILSLNYRDNLNGTDLSPMIMERAERLGLSCYLLGGKEGSAARAAANFLKMFPNLKISGVRNGYFSDSENVEIVNEINSCSPDILFVGLGVKKQEKWIVENSPSLNAKAVLGVGGLFDHYSGDFIRANPLVRKMGLEWVWRLIQEPVRLSKRYLIGNPLFVMRVLRYKFFGMPKN